MLRVFGIDADSIRSMILFRGKLPGSGNGIPARGRSPVPPCRVERPPTLTPHGGPTLTNNIAQIVAGVLVVASAILAYLLSQPDVLFAPELRVILGALNVGVTALALYLRVTLPGQSKPS